MAGRLYQIIEVGVLRSDFVPNVYCQLGPIDANQPRPHRGGQSPQQLPRALSLTSFKSETLLRSASTWRSFSASSMVSLPIPPRKAGMGWGGVSP